MKTFSAKYTLLLILSMISGSVFSQKLKQADHENQKKDTVILFNKRIIINTPAIMGNGPFETENILEIEDRGTMKILKFSSLSNGNSSWLYIQNKGNKIYSTKELNYSNGIYQKRLKKNDFDYLPATRICTKKRLVMVDKSISLADFFRFTPDDCYKCPITISVDDCIKNGKIKYKW
ncbi:hypothetical protein [Chryseobacterium indologenes]|nr:hypothetical protein [Chryseobacterium indologenes]